MPPAKRTKPRKATAESTAAKVQPTVDEAPPAGAVQVDEGRTVVDEGGRPVVAGGGQ